jgi:hypothetical protein
MAPQEAGAPLLERLLLVSLGEWRDLSWDESPALAKEAELIGEVQVELNDRLVTPTGTALESALCGLRDAFPSCSFAWLMPDRAAEGE